YGGTYNLFHHTLPRLGINVNFVDPADYDGLKKAIGPRTKAVYAETVGNPKMDVIDLEKFAGIAHAAGVPFIIDNTCAPPPLCRPLQWGADLVIHSLTKFIGGHGTSIGGVIVDGGKFDWAKSGRFAEFTDPDPTYHGVSYTGAFGPLAFIIKARVQGLRDTGACISPFNAFLILQGAETLHLRMIRHSENAIAVARYLKKHPLIEWVEYAGLEDSRYHALCRKYMPDGAGALIVFGIRGGAQAGKRFINSVKL